MKIGLPILRVRNIDKILAFYEKKLGLQVKRRHQDDYGDAVYELGFKGVDQTKELSLLQLPTNTYK